MRIDDQNRSIAGVPGAKGGRAARTRAGATSRAIAVLVLFLFLLPARGALCAGHEVPLIDAAGLRALLDAQRGKVVVLNFWATWCGPCRQELPHLMALRRAYPEDALYMAGVSMDYDQRAAAEFAARERPGYPLYFAGTDVPRAFSVGAIPKTMIWGPDGALLDEHVGVAEEDSLRRAVDAALGRASPPGD